MTDPISDEEFRIGGRTGAARNHPLSEAGYHWLCAYNGIAPDKAPPSWRYASNAYMRDYIEQQAMKDQTP